MKYGIYYAYWEKQWGADYLKYVKKVKDQGFDILEISCAGIKDMPKEEIEKLKAYKDELGIELTAGYGPKPTEDISSSDPGNCKKCISVLERDISDIKGTGCTYCGRWTLLQLAGRLF